MKKINLCINKNYKGITLIAPAATVYNAMLVKSVKILGRIRMDFGKNRSTKSQILSIRRNILAVCTENLVEIIDLTKASDSIHEGKMEQILIAYDHSKKC